MEPQKFLILDRDPDHAAFMAEMVRSLGHPCRAVTNPAEVLLLARAEPWDLFITDYRLPKDEWRSFMTQAKGALPPSAFVIVTGFGADYTYDGIIGAGADDFIKKPYTSDEFKAKLRRIVNEQRLAAENASLLETQSRLNERLASLLAIARELTAQLDVDRLFQIIVAKVTEAMSAERTSLYIIDWDRQELWTKVAEQVREIRLPLGEGISGRVAISGQAINVADAWDLPYFNRDFDRKHDFRTKAVLCLPIRNQPGELIGVLQVINKTGGKVFDGEDETFLEALTAQVGIALENSLLHEELRLSFDRSIRTLSATVDARHPLTAGHSQRVTDYSLLIAREMGVSGRDLEVLQYAAILHDIGKIGVRDHVLLKDGPFTPEERAEMNTHPYKTRVILENFHFPRALREVPLVAAAHHEKIDGQGYPEALSGDEIPLGSKILALADVFDALTSPRDYPKYDGQQVLGREPMPLDRAMAIVTAGSGNHFEPSVVEAFLRSLPALLLSHRGEHFPRAYVDGTLRRLAPNIKL